MINKIFISIFLWLCALVITVGTAYFQRKTGPTYPVAGLCKLNDILVSYEFLRSHGGAGDQPVKISVTDTSIYGELVYRRYKTDDSWSTIKMIREGDTLKAWLPHQPPAGKLEYHVELNVGSHFLTIPSDENIVTRFKGDVPEKILVMHIIFIFCSILFSARTGLESVRKEKSVTVTKKTRIILPIVGGFLFGLEPFSKNIRLKIYCLATLALLILGGFIYGPIVQKYAFDAYWTGFPFGMDLTDNKTLIALVAWIIATIMLFCFKKGKFWTLAASVVMLLVFLIPHSWHGSELDYSKMDGENLTSEQRIDINKSCC